MRKILFHTMRCVIYLAPVVLFAALYYFVGIKAFIIFLLCAAISFILFQKDKED